MAVSSDYKDFIRELLVPFGPVTIRAMFGGAGVYGSTPDGPLMFGLLDDDMFFLKVDGETRADFLAEGMEPFSYETKEGRREMTGYYRAPERLLDDPDEMKLWAEKAFDVARRAAERKKRKHPGRDRRAR
ncbi:MAG: TfoX/Sxy family protein [Alphaproteobacteria bacterium]